MIFKTFEQINAINNDYNLAKQKKPIIKINKCLKILTNISNINTKYKIIYRPHSYAKCYIIFKNVMIDN